jgi:RNA polymerase sigma-70 factor (ECF subfamily)
LEPVVAGFLWLPQDRDAAPYRGSFVRRSGELSGCYGWRTGRFEFVPCLRLTVEDVSARGTGPEVLSTRNEANGLCDGRGPFPPRYSTMTSMHAAAPTGPSAPSAASGREISSDETETAKPMQPPTFRAVYDQHFDFVWSCTRRLGVPLEAIDDVVQEIFIVVHSRLKTLERPASLRSWLYSVVRRTVSTYHRAQHTRTARESSDHPFDESADALQPSPLDLAVLKDKMELLWRVLGRLDPAKREVLILAELEEMSAPEIAEAVGIPLNTAYSRLRLARAEFNEAFLRDAAQRETRE